jgi:cytidine deaminase
MPFITMFVMKNEELIQLAKSVIKPREIQCECTVGDVGCALVTKNGKTHVGVCIDASSGIGFCAEHAAIASMVTSGEENIKKIVAIASDGTILPPCGRCRELIYQLNQANLNDTDVIITHNKMVKLRELLPYPWGEAWQ